MLINMVTERRHVGRAGVTADQALARVALIEDGSPSLGAYARAMVESAVDRGILAPPRRGQRAPTYHGFASRNRDGTDMIMTEIRESRNDHGRRPAGGGRGAAGRVRVGI